MKRNHLAATAVAATAALTLSLGACSSDSGDNAATNTPEPTDTETSATPEPTDTAAPEAGDITLWLAGGDTGDSLRTYLKDTFAAENPGSTLTIEEVSWGDLVTKLTTALPDPANTPDVAEIGNTQSATFTTVGAFLDITDLYEELGGDNLLQGFVEAGKFDGKNYALPYYFGSRYVFYRKDLWEAKGLDVPATLGEFNDAVIALRTDSVSGLAIGGQDWRNGISWVFANGGDLASVDGTTWTSTLSDPATIEGLTQWQSVYQGASNLDSTISDAAYWNYISTGEVTDANTAATIIAPGWAHWSIGDTVADGTNDDGSTKYTPTWNDDVWGVFALPGVDGGVAPVFAGGSNIGISAASQNPELAKNLLRIIFSEDYQNLLGGAGLGPANREFVSSLGDDQFAEALIASSENAKLTPAAPGFAAIEGQKVYEEFFQKIAEGGDVAALAAEYDAKITPLLNNG